MTFTGRRLKRTSQTKNQISEPCANPCGSLFVPLARSRCRQCAIAATPAPSATLAAATFPSRWIAKKVHPFYKMGAAIHRAGKVLYSVSPSPFCPSFACLPKVRAAPSSVRRSLDGAKPQDRTPRAGFQPGTNLSLP